MHPPINFIGLAPGELLLDNRPGVLDTWDLRPDDGLVGTVERSQLVGRVRGLDGSWSVQRQRRRRRLGWRLVFSPLHDEDGAMACFYPRHVLPGGTIALSDERWFELHPPGFFGRPWRLSDREGQDLARMPIKSRGWPARSWLMSLDERAVGEPEALLIVLAACYAIADDQAQHPLSGGG